MGSRPPIPSLSREDKTYWGTVSSHPGARNREETRSPEDRHLKYLRGTKDARRIHLPSLQTVPVQKRDPASKDCSLHTHAEWSGRMDQPDDPGKGEAGILGRNIVDRNISDQSVAIESNQARSTASTMVREGTDLRQTSYIQMWSLRIHPTG